MNKRKVVLLLFLVIVCQTLFCQVDDLHKYNKTIGIGTNWLPTYYFHNYYSTVRDEGYELYFRYRFNDKHYLQTGIIFDYRSYQGSELGFILPYLSYKYKIIKIKDRSNFKLGIEPGFYNSFNSDIRSEPTKRYYGVGINCEYEYFIIKEKLSFTTSIGIFRSLNSNDNILQRLLGVYLNYSF